MHQFAYGFDFGTSKTALACAKCDGTRPTVADLMLDRSRDSERIATCLLRRRNTDEVLIGTEAAEEYLLAGDGKRGDYEFLANFKPHVHQRPEAQDAARQFLQQLASSEAVRRDFQARGNDAILVVGRPASWPLAGGDTLLDLLIQNGYPRAYSLPEPVGALFYHMASRLRAEDAHRDLLIVDWGAGTLDFTLMRGGNLHEMHFWGSNLLGGRLFDDLFYQWIVDYVRQEGRNPAVLDEVLRSPLYDGYLATSVAREVKEAYSNAIRSNRVTGPWTYPRPLVLGDMMLGRFAIESVALFESRARHYSPSMRARTWLNWSEGETNRVDRPYVEALKQEAPIDLLQWARDALDFAITQLGVDADGLAILTGGSTKWRWFEQLVEQHDHFRRQGVERVLTDEKPELSIARGLCRAYAVGGHAQSLIDLLASKEQEVAGRLVAEIYAPRLAKLVEDLSNAMLSDIQKDVQLVFYRFQCGDLTEDNVVSRLSEITNHWISGKGRDRVRALATAFSEAARQDVWELLKRCDIRVDDLLRMAAEVCSPAGGTDLAGGLSDLGGRVQFLPGWWEAFLKGIRRYLADLVRGLFGGEPTAQELDTLRESEATEMTSKFRVNLPAELSRTIVQIQSGEQWALQVLGYIRTTLDGIARLSRGQ